MKKIFLVLLALLFFLPCFSSAEISKSDLRGLWSCYIYERSNDSPGPMNLYTLRFDDSLVFICSYSYAADDEGNFLLVPMHYSEHRFSVDGDDISFQDDHAPSGISPAARYSGGQIYATFDGELWRRFFRSPLQLESSDIYTAETIPAAFPGASSLLESGTVIPAGIYAVGVDIPAGSYEITAQSSTRIIIRASSTSSAKPTTFDVPEGGFFGKVTLEPGNIFSVSPGSIVLKTYRGLFN